MSCCLLGKGYHHRATTNSAKNEKAIKIAGSSLLCSCHYCVTEKPFTFGLFHDKGNRFFEKEPEVDFSHFKATSGLLIHLTTEFWNDIICWVTL